jgi:branched-chain amino acid transport system permease protein
VTLAGLRLPAYDLVLIGAAPVVLLLLWLLLRRTRWGVLVRAATADREMVGALGVNQAWLFTSVFFLGSFLAGLAGALQLPKGGASLLMDTGTIAAAFVVVVIGGMGSIVGAFLASIIIGELQAFGVLLLPQLSPVVMFLAMAVVLVLRPWGLLGRPDTGPVRAAVTAELVPRLPPRALGIAWAAVILVLLLLPLAADEFALVLAVEVLVLALFAASLHAIMGPGGLASFGHAAYFGGGAYAAALAASRLGWAMPAALPLAPVAAGVLALAFGWLCVRLRGVYFAMLTLAFAELLWSVAVQWTGLTGGDDGILGVWPAGWAADRRHFYYLVLAFVLAGVLLLRRATASPFGYALRAGRDSPMRAEAVGIDVARQQWLAFTLSGACAGLAGGLYLYAKGSVFPNEASIGRSFDALMMVLLGGVQTAGGPLVGAAAYTLLEATLSRFQLWRLLLGLAIILLVIVFPQGLAGLLGRRPAEA